MIGTKEFLTEVLDVLNLKYELSKDKRHKNNTYFINFRKNDSIQFLDFIYKDATIYLDRKYELYIKTK